MEPRRSMNEISWDHPVITFGGMYEILEPENIVQEYDETACVSCLLHPEYAVGEWRHVTKGKIGKTVEELTSKDAQDCDGWDRVFRRGTNQMTQFKCTLNCLRIPYSEEKTEDRHYIKFENQEFGFFGHVEFVFEPVSGKFLYFNVIP